MIETQSETSQGTPRRFLRLQDMGICALAGLPVGLVSGAIIGALLISTGAMELAAVRFQASSVSVAFAMHMFFSGLMGLIFGLVFGHTIKTLRRAVLVGVLVSVFFWVFGLLVVKPYRLGEPFGWESIVSSLHILVGHGVFGAILGSLYLQSKNWIRKQGYRLAAVALTGLWAGLVLGIAA